MHSFKELETSLLHLEGPSARLEKEETHRSSIYTIKMNANSAVLMCFLSTLFVCLKL